MSTTSPNGKSTEGTDAAPTAAAPVPAESSSTAPAAAPSETKPDFKVWNPPRDNSTVRLQDLPDSYFEPTSDELRREFASSQRRLQGLTDAPLRTSKARDEEEKVRRARYPTTTIRVRFADRTMLERTFQSTDKIRNVYKFVRDSLTEEGKAVKFILYQPPKQEYKVSDPNVRDKTLYDLHFAPSSILLLTFEGDELNRHDVPPPLLPEILARAQDLPTAPVDPEPPKGGGQKLGSAKDGKTAAAGSGSASKTVGASAQEKKEKLARLLKLGGKK